MRITPVSFLPFLSTHVVHQLITDEKKKKNKDESVIEACRFIKRRYKAACNDAEILIKR